jgi:hypothetical protein
MLSEVARIREQIEQECIAMRRMTGEFAQVASHAAIAKQYARIEMSHTTLAGLVGEKQATDTMCAIYNKVIG